MGFFKIVIVVVVVVGLIHLPNGTQACWCEPRSLYDLYRHPKIFVVAGVVQSVKQSFYGRAMTITFTVIADFKKIIPEKGSIEIFANKNCPLDLKIKGCYVISGSIDRSPPVHYITNHCQFIRKCSEVTSDQWRHLYSQYRL